MLPTLDTTVTRSVLCVRGHRGTYGSRLHILGNPHLQLAATSICMFLHSVAVISYLLRSLCHWFLNVLTEHGSWRHKLCCGNTLWHKDLWKKEAWQVFPHFLGDGPSHAIAFHAEGKFVDPNLMNCLSLVPLCFHKSQSVKTEHLSYSIVGSQDAHVLCGG